MVKTAGAILIFFSLYVASLYSLPSPHSSSHEFESSSDSDGKSSSLPLPSNYKVTAPPPPLLPRAPSLPHPAPPPTTLPVPPLVPPAPGGSDGTSAKEANGGREWLSAAVMPVDGGVAVGFFFFRSGHRGPRAY